MIARSTALLIHRVLSLSLALLWTMQAATGVFAVFHWEIDDATLAGAHRATDLAAIERSLDALAPPGSGRRIASIWTSGGAPDRYDIAVEATHGAAESVRIDGVGRVLRRRLDGERLSHGGWVETLVSLHHDLLAGTAGKWIIGMSGGLLLANLALGLALAWPRPGLFRRAFRPSDRGPIAARLFSWHRAVGLWALLPALLSVAAGVALVYDDLLERFVTPVAEAPVVVPRGAAHIGLAEAIAVARARHPRAAVSGVGFPSREDATWSVRLNQPGEAIRAYGKTRVAVSAVDGRVTLDQDELKAPPSRWAFDHVFAFHTGEIAGPAGRAAMLGIGLWLLTMVGLGLNLWLARRAVRRRGL